MIGEGRFNKYIAPLAAGLAVAIGSTACGGKSKFEACDSSQSPIVNSTGTWAEKTADTVACYIESVQKKDFKKVKVTFRDGQEFVMLKKPVESDISGAGQGGYELTAEITGWAHGHETVDSVEVMVNGGIKKFDPIYLLAIFRENGQWSFDQEIVQKNGELISVDSGTPDAPAQYSEIARLATQILCKVQHGDTVSWIVPGNLGAKQIMSNCTAS